MTETRFSLMSIVLGGIAGLVVGLIVGGVIGFVVAPVRGTNVDISDLKPDAQDNFIVLVADAYAYDHDLPRAQQRLAQINDKDIKTRLSKLAKSYASKDEQVAARLAALDLALGSNDGSLRTLAQDVTNNSSAGVPTKFAQAPATPTPAPTDTPTNTPAATSTVTPTNAPKSTSAPKPTATRVPATAAPALAPALQPEFHPDLSQWWDSQYIPANVSPGQQYWRLKYARYCDWSPDENHNTCPNMPGGIMDHTIYIMVLDASGGCAQNVTVKDLINDGSVDEYGNDKAKTVAFPWYPGNCNTDYEKEMYGEGNTISVEGFPSDTITNMVLCSKNQPAGFSPPPCGHAHVHYFVVFQLTTR